jgi:hypothetical protein
MTQYFDLALIQKNLAKAKADVEFWENVSAILNDPRISSMPVAMASMEPRPIQGDLRSRVYHILPENGAVGISITEMVKRLTAEGYVFAAKNEGVAVNDALRILLRNKTAIKVGKTGLAILWTKGESQEPAGAGS